MSKENADSYFSLENMQKRAAALKGGAKEIAERLLAERQSKSAKPRWEHSKVQIKELFWKKDVGDAKDFEKVMSLGSDERRAVEALVGKDNARLAAKMWERAFLYPYEIGIYRRHYRTKKYAPLYLSKNLYALLGFMAAVADGFTLDVYLKERAKGDKAKDFGNERSFVPPLLAALLDEGDPASDTLFARLSEIVLDESGRATVTREIIAGLLRSRRGDAHELVGKLLLAARLQEGLRQAVLEEADMGSKEGFMYLFKLALDENLIRFSSVSRAFCVWLGIDFDVVSTSGAKRIKQTYEDAWKCLTDEAFRAECLNGKDARKISLALWAVSAEGIEFAEDEIARILNVGPRHRVVVALRTASQFQNMEIQTRLATLALANPDYRADGEITGAALHCLNVLYRVQLSRDKAVELYGHLKLLADSYKKNEHYSRDNLFTIMTNILARKQEKTSGGYSSGGSKTETNEWGIPIHEGYHSRQEPMILDELDEPVSLRDDLCGYLGQMNANSRHLFLREVVRNGSASPVQRDVLVRSLADRSGWSSSQAWQHLKKLPLTDDEVKTLEGFLRFKDGAMRQHVYLKLLDQNPKKLGESIQRLRSDKDKMRAAAGEELLSILGRRKTEAKYQDVWLACAGPEAEEEGGEKAAEKKTSAAPALDPFFDLYDSAAPLTEFSLDAPDLSPEKLFPITFEQVKKFLDAFDAAIIQNAEYQYKAQGGYTVVLGAEGWLRSVYRPDGDYDRESRRALGLDNYPLPEVWRDLARKLGVTAKFIVLFNKLELARKSRNDYDQKPDWLFSLPWFSGFAQVAADVREYYGKKSIKHPRKIETLAGTLQTEIPPAERYAVLRPIVRAFLTEEAGNPKKYYSYVDPWFGSLRVAAVSDEDFTDCFKLTYGCVCRSLEKNNSLSFDARDFARVHALGLLSEEELTRLLVSYGKVAPPLFYTLTEPKRSEKIEIFKTYPRFTPVRDRIVQRVVETEIRRGEMATSVSGIAGHIERFEGARHFVDILERMGKNKNPFDRSGYGTNTKRAMLSHLIQACRPTSGEDAAALGKLLEGKNIPTQTLLDGAMFAPQWIGLVAEHLGWKGLESACWYFHAHVNENFSAEKETIVARFSDIAPQDFNDGAFDVEWFREAHAALGKERFAMVYSAAKYISGGASHRRAQLFADAVTGKLKLSETEAEVVKKRSKNHVLCYGLIPFKKGGKKDAGASTKDILHRYEVLQKFLKESKQFGAQRRASEALVVRVSTENLARGAGYGNVTRFVWSMEGEKLDSVKPYFEKKNVEDVTLRLQADADGKVELKVEAKGKELKDVPSRVKKDPYVEELREVQKSLRDQYSRARLTMEQAMEREEKFEAGELAKLAVHPVIGPIVNKLVFRSKDGLGYIQDFKRQTDELIVAHPVHLMESGRWSEFQRELFDKEIRQPFKQVFRELYVPTEDELSEGSVSRRYAGHQVQPKRGVALLRTRGWTVHYEEGLQKVYHKENLVAEIYAAADWFSPADVEPPTLEYVTFHSRKDYKTVPIADVPKIIFSEVMRDVDLMVSVAHAGGVDPEASASTVETRRAIAAEVVRLFKLDNVRFEGTHAFIKGVRGEYTVHLGSALAHKMAAGALYVLAVPSQHRGRIFLPFVDEDPRTAEVMSKILLFAEDGKIKDPAILSQMRGEEP